MKFSTKIWVVVWGCSSLPRGAPPVRVNFAFPGILAINFIGEIIGFLVRCVDKKAFLGI
jgi:hypothetical protein